MSTAERRAKKEKCAEYFPKITAIGGGEAGAAVIEEKTKEQFYFFSPTPKHPKHQPPPNNAQQLSNLLPRFRAAVSRRDSASGSGDLHALRSCSSFEPSALANRLRCSRLEIMK